MLLVDLATEDELSEAIGIRLLSEVPGIGPGLLLRRGGSGYLRSRLKAFCEMARVRPLLIATDLDTAPCPAVLRDNWMGIYDQPTNFLFRVAVREVESWLLADHAAVVTLLGAFAARHLPDNPDALRDPKNHLLQIAQRAPREVRADLCAPSGALARQGLGYNVRLCGLVREHWNPERASLRSESLRRLRQRINALIRVRPRQP